MNAVRRRLMLHLFCRSLSLLFLCAVVSAGVSAQTAKPMSEAEIRSAAGNELTAPGPLATDLRPAFTHRNVRYAMRKVADWQLGQSPSKFDQDWTYAPLYLGLLATTATTHDRRPHDAVLAAAESFQWKLWANRALHADDEAIAQAYEQLYLDKPDPVRIADARATFDRLVERPDDPAKDLWWWCDALFMAPAGLAEMSAITGDPRYREKMNTEWQITAKHLYDPQEHLFFRDSSYFGKTEANGKKIFWGRGNGWVLAGLVNVLKTLPKNDPSRSSYLALYREMSERVAGLQQTDGLWHSGLLDQRAYPLPEISGSAFFTYALAWGVHEGILDRATYLPVVQRAWAGLLQHVYADGRLGCIQPIGAAPGAFGPSSSYVYGVGAFLLAGSEIDRLSR